MTFEPFPPVETVDGDPDVAFLILCDHASNALPAAYGSLGLPPAQLARHIGYDIGARATVLDLARRLRAPALLTTFSRLLIDPNRGEDDPTLVMRLSDGAVVPGNARVDANEIATRIARFHRPYHQAIERQVDSMLARGLVPILVSVHTFTPVWRGVPRPWHAGLLWDRDDRLARLLIDALASDPTLVVGDNEPYDGALRGDTMWQHGTMRGLPHAILEIRQDLVATGAGARDWGARLAAILTQLAPLPQLRRRTYVGSRTDRPGETTMDDRTRTELEAAVFRRLVEHLRKRTDVQNIDMMNLAGFCRNCLSNWMKDAADERGVPLTKDDSRVAVYGMPYDEWKAKHQSAASAEQKAAFDQSIKQHH